jgi:hypothetical protein
LPCRAVVRAPGKNRLALGTKGLARLCKATAVAPGPCATALGLQGRDERSREEIVWHWVQEG